MKKIESGEIGNLPSTKIDDGSFLTPYKVFTRRLFIFGSIFLECLLSITLFSIWMFTRFVQTEVGIREYLHASEHAKMFNTIVTMCILSTMKKARNHPIYWRLKWCLFHYVMGSKFLLWKILSKLYYELSWYICLILYSIQLITKPFVYWRVVFYVILLCITTPNVKNLKQNESDFCIIQGFYTS